MQGLLHILNNVLLNKIASRLPCGYSGGFTATILLRLTLCKPQSIVREATTHGEPQLGELVS